MFETYLLPIIIFVAIGLLAGLLLAVFSVLFAVKKNEKTDKVREALPGVNCGACGYSNCDVYAEKIAQNEAPANLCVPGGDKTAKRISEIMGTAAKQVNERVAFVSCGGNCDVTKNKYRYETGVMSCTAVKKHYCGNGKCSYSCMGFGDCVSVCDFDAIHVINGVSQVDVKKCVGCGKCVKACPASLIVMVEADKKVNVKCSSRATGKNTRLDCKNGCIACGRCEKTCRYDAIHVENNLAVIDYNKCTDCGECVHVCPVKCISQKE